MTGAELRKIRIKMQMTQVELAKTLGVSGNTIARWERDEVSIPPYLGLALKAVPPKK